MQSMTGFAAEAGAAEGRRWRWEARSVNARGLDLRLRLSDGSDLTEADLRPLVQKRLTRGSVQISLKFDGAAAPEGLVLNEAALDAALGAVERAAALAEARGLLLAPSTAADVAAMRGVLEPGAPPADDEALRAALLATFEATLDALLAARAGEGARLAAALSGQVDRIEALAAEAAAAHEAQGAAAASRIAERVAALMAASSEAGAAPDPDRLAQELALIAMKADVREELDRLSAHIAAARDLLAADGPVGRKLDFLTQEFNREVNTICAKSNSAALTHAGLEMKVVVDQLREQAQNVE
ncbi:MAG: YicC/YloC family endoribonuclease [Pseudomonadota bacterium]